MRRRKLFMATLRMLLTTCVVVTFIPACSNPDDPPPEDPLSTDFFPPMAVGDTIAWDYLYYNRDAGMLMDWLEGQMMWTVTAIDNGVASKVTRVRQRFSGLLTKHRSDTPYVRDSIWIAADTTYASINEDGNHNVTVATQATGRYANYGGRDVTFPRFPADVQGDTLQVTTSGGGGGYGNTVKARRAFGFVYYYDWVGPGMTQYRTTMKRR